MSMNDREAIELCDARIAETTGQEQRIWQQVKEQIKETGVKDAIEKAAIWLDGQDQQGRGHYRDDTRYEVYSEFYDAAR